MLLSFVVAAIGCISTVLTEFIVAAAIVV